MKKSVEQNSNSKPTLTPNTNSIYFDYLYVDDNLLRLYANDLAKIYNNENKNGTHFEQIGLIYQCKDYEFTIHTSKLDNGDRLASLKLQFAIDDKKITVLVPRKNIKHNYNDACLTEKNNILFLKKNLETFRKMAKTAQFQEKTADKNSSKKTLTIFSYAPPLGDTETFILSEKQGQILNTLTFQKKAVLFGPAGTGKTHLGVSLFEQYYKNNPDNKKISLYIVSQQQQRLKGQVKNEWEKKWNDTAPGMVLFITDYELMLLYLSEANDMSVANVIRQFTFENKKDFCTWYDKRKSTLLKPYKASCLRNENNKNFEEIRDKPEIIYDVIASVAGFSEDEFISLGNRSYSFDNNCRKLLYFILNERRLYCEENRIIDLQLYRISENTWIKKFGMVVFDEFQNVGLQQLIDASKIAEKIVYCGDSHQTLENKAATIQNLFLWFQLNQIKPSLQILTETFRNPPEITALANHCFHGKHITNGSFNKHEANKIITAEESNQKSGNVCYLHSPGKEALAEFASMTTNHARGVIALYERELDNAKKMFPKEEGVFAVNQIHGTEFDYVYIYVSLSRIKGIADMTYRLRTGKAIQSDWDDVLFFWNALILCITRARIKVCIINPDPAATKNELSQFFSEAILEGKPIITHWTGEDIKESTREELLERVKDIIPVDIKKALTYFSSCKLGTEEDFAILCREVIGATLDMVSNSPIEYPAPAQFKDESSDLSKSRPPQKSLAGNKKTALDISSVLDNFTEENIVSVFENGQANDLFFNTQKNSKTVNLILILKDKTKCYLLSSVLWAENKYIAIVDGEKFSRCLMAIDTNIQGFWALVDLFVNFHPKGFQHLFTKYTPDLVTAPKSRGNRRAQNTNIQKLSLSEYLAKSSMGCRLLHYFRDYPEILHYITREWLDSNIENLSMSFHGHLLLLHLSSNLKFKELFTPEMLLKGQHDKAKKTKIPQIPLENLMLSFAGLQFIVLLVRNNHKILKLFTESFIEKNMESFGYSFEVAASFTKLGTGILELIHMNFKRKNSTFYLEAANYPAEAAIHYQKMLQFISDPKEAMDALFNNNINYDGEYSISIFDFMFFRPDTRSFMLDYIKERPQLFPCVNQNIHRLLSNPKVLYTQPGKEILRLLANKDENLSIYPFLISHRLSEIEKCILETQQKLISPPDHTGMIFSEKKMPGKLSKAIIQTLDKIPGYSDDLFMEKIAHILTAPQAEVTSKFFDSLSDDPHDCLLARILNSEKYIIFRKLVKDGKFMGKFNPERLPPFLAYFKPLPDFKYRYFHVDFSLLIFDYNKNDSIFLRTPNIHNGQISILEILFNRLETSNDMNRLFRYLLSIQKYVKKEWLINFIIQCRDIWIPENAICLSSALEDGTIEEILFDGIFNNRSETNLFNQLLPFEWGIEALQKYFENHGKQSKKCVDFLKCAIVPDSVLLIMGSATVVGHKLLLAIIKSGVLDEVFFLPVLTLPNLSRSPIGLECINEILRINKNNQFSLHWDSIKENHYALWHAAQFTHSGKNLLQYTTNRKNLWSKEQDIMVEILYLCLKWLYFAPPSQRYEVLTSKQIFCFENHECMLDFLLSTPEGIGELKYFLDTHPDIIGEFHLRDLTKPLQESILENDHSYIINYSDFFQEKLIAANGAPNTFLMTLSNNPYFLKQAQQYLLDNPLINIYKDRPKPIGILTHTFFGETEKNIEQEIDPSEVYRLCYLYMSIPLIGGQKLVTDFIYSFFEGKSPLEILPSKKMLFQKFSLTVKLEGTPNEFPNRTIFCLLTQFSWGCDVLSEILNYYIGDVDDPIQDPNFLHQISLISNTFVNCCSYESGLKLLMKFIRHFHRWLNPIHNNLFFDLQFDVFEDTVSPADILLKNPACLLEVLKYNKHLLEELKLIYPENEQSVNSFIVQKMSNFLSNEIIDPDSIMGSRI